jgi:gas vesicle protein
MMDEDRAAHPVTFVAGFILGAMVGAGIALLAAPEAGTRTRRRIKKVAGELKESAGDHWDDLAEDVKDKVDDAVRGARKRLVVKRD